MNILQKIETRTSNGMLSKGIYEKNGRRYLVKGNSSLGYREPLSEYIASNIAKIMNYDCVEYWLEESSKFKEIKTFKNCEYVSVCEVLPYSIYKYYDTLVENSSSIHKIYTIDGFIDFGLNVDDLIRLLLFDALIGNYDRHLNNMDIVVKSDGNIELCKPLDFGNSLLSNLAEFELKTYSGKIGPDKSKPFKETHQRQVNLLKRYMNKDYYFEINNCKDKNELLSKIYSFINSIDSKYITDKRKESLKSYITERFNFYLEPYVKFSNIAISNKLSW